MLFVVALLDKMRSVLLFVLQLFICCKGLAVHNRHPHKIDSPSPPFVRADFEKSQVFCSKICVRWHLKNPPHLLSAKCPHWITPWLRTSFINSS